MLGPRRLLTLPGAFTGSRPFPSCDLPSCDLPSRLPRISRLPAQLCVHGRLLTPARRGSCGCGLGACVRRLARRCENPGQFRSSPGPSIPFEKKDNNYLPRRFLPRVKRKGKERKRTDATRVLAEQAGLSGDSCPPSTQAAAPERAATGADSTGSGAGRRAWP